MSCSCQSGRGAPLGCEQDASCQCDLVMSWSGAPTASAGWESSPSGTGAQVVCLFLTTGPGCGHQGWPHALQWQGLSMSSAPNLSTLPAGLRSGLNSWPLIISADTYLQVPPLGLETGLPTHRSYHHINTYHSGPRESSQHCPCHRPGLTGCPGA